MQPSSSRIKFQRAISEYIRDANDCFAVVSRDDIDDDLYKCILTLATGGEKEILSNILRLDLWCEAYDSEDFSYARSYFWNAGLRTTNREAVAVGTLTVERFQAIRTNQSLVVDEWGLILG